MALFRPIPPPDRNAPFTEQVDWSARRDPVGHRVHLSIAMLALALIPLSSTLATIGSTLLSGYAALRAPSIHRCWRPLGRNTSLLMLLALLAWLAIGLTWSTDPAHGTRLLRGSRYLLLIPALLPLVRHANLLLYGVCAGVLIQNIAQWLATDGTGGLSEHAGYAALWFTLGISALVLVPSRDNTEGIGIFRKFLAVIPTIGIVHSAARSALLGCTGALLTGMALAWVRGRRDRASVVIAGCLLIALSIILSFNPSTSINQRMLEGLDAARDTQNMDVVTHRDQVRTLWWRIGLDALKEHPIAGEGLGSTAGTIENDEEVVQITEGGRINGYVLRDDYHSLFVTVGAAGGLVGLALLFGWLITLVIQILRSGALDAILLASLASFLVFSMLNTTLFSGRLIAFAAILMALSTCPLPRQLTVRDATRAPS